MVRHDRSYTSPALTNVREKILKQLRDSVDLFVSAVVVQAAQRVKDTRSLADTVVLELDEWIGSVVAAETASVGHMRKAMLVAIKQSVAVDEDTARPVPKVRMRYGVDVPDDGPITTLFDVRGSGSTLRNPTSFLISTSSLRPLIQNLRSAALESARLNQTNVDDPMSTLARTTFIDVVHRTATSGVLTDMW